MGKEKNKRKEKSRESQKIEKEDSSRAGDTLAFGFLRSRRREVV